MSVAALLARLGLQRHAAVFEEEELTDVALLRSMGTLLDGNLAELGLAAADREALCLALSSEPTDDPRARSGCGVGSDDDGDEDGGLLLEDNSEAVGVQASHTVHLGREEFERLMEESDDDDTPQGRARRRIESNLAPETYRAHMLGPNDEGIVVDVSAGPRHALKKLLRAGDGLSNPTPGSEVELRWVGRVAAAMEAFAADGAVFDREHESEARTMLVDDARLPPGLWKVRESPRVQPCVVV